MRRIYAIGETVYDIIFKESVPRAANAGGSMLNTAISLGRLDMPVSFISEYGNDYVGKTIDSFLNSNNVCTKYVFKYQKGLTALALAFLDSQNNADYDFYKIYPEKRFDIIIPEIRKNDILLFGSFYAITKDIRKNLIKLLETAKQNNAIIIYDPNFRKSHLPDLPIVKELIIENISYATIVRGSNEDFAHIFNTGDISDSYDCIKDKCNILIYTANKDGVFIKTPTVEINIPVKQIKPVSTIGAGDTFNAGIIYSIIKQDITFNEISLLKSYDWESIISAGIDFSTEVCLGYDNYISNTFANSILK